DIERMPLDEAPPMVTLSMAQRRSTLPRPEAFGPQNEMDRKRAPIFDDDDVGSVAAGASSYHQVGLSI
ncbi:hypothetical protein, partial [Sinorhizobium meliloti]|uniref:hypothetical protein n=1 Tax=Rhizobium meliloti TaxID=382 RepID=UPI001AEC7CDA